MTATTRMLETHPQAHAGLDRLSTCIDACLSCAQACTACADACLGEGMIDDLVRCIRTDLDCADLCATTAQVLSRQTSDDTEVVRLLVEACATACKVCGDECARHADMHEHCRVCAEACRACEQACRDLLAA
jgi:hypothetical protein